MNRYRVVIADDHAMFRHGMKRILSERSDLEVVAEAKDGLELLDKLKTAKADMVVLDISMPQLRGTEAIHEIKRLYNNVKIVMLTMHKDSDYVYQAVSAGADGYVLKEDAERDLFVAMDTVRRGEVYISRLVAADSWQDWMQIRGGHGQSQPYATLTLRERQILKLISEGRSSKEIGEVLFISFRTVERHRANIMDKLNVKKSADLVRYAVQKGYA